MKFQLANGKTITITEEQYFKMSDQDLKDLEGSNYGFEINDPFSDSILKGDILDIILEDIDDLEDIPPLDLNIIEEEE